MKLVIDSNVLFTLFWKNATATDLVIFQDLELFTPQFTLQELEKYKKDIMKKAIVEQKEFCEIQKELQMLITFVPLQTYASFFQKAIKICPDPNDIDFFALALKKDCAIWSNDKVLRQQKTIKILTTKEVIELFD